jgi:FdhD protein
MDPGLDTERPSAEVMAGVVRFAHGATSTCEDVLAAEEPLEIRLLWFEEGEECRKSIAITMRTPGDDFALAAGFLFGEGVIGRTGDVVDIAYCADEAEPQRFNIVTVTLRPGLVFDVARLERNVFASSSCGVCGKANLEALEVMGCTPMPAGFRLSPATIQSFPERLKATQAIFSRTGGLHASAMFDPAGEIIALNEDVGRHNALDKLIGNELLAGRIPLEDRGIVLSGRASFELLQKSLVARIPFVVALGAPSSLAVSLAREFGITLVGFARADGFNVYSRPDRIATVAAAVRNG